MKVALFASILLALAMSAGAQTMIDFTGLPPAATPTAIPENYGGMSWSGIVYVSPMMWDYANGTKEVGDGFMHGPEAQLGFGGGPMCYKKHGGQTSRNVCSGTISAGVGPNALHQFTPVSVDIAAGWASDAGDTVPFVTVQAYSDGNLMGTLKFELGTHAEMHTLVFPNWGPITELKFIPDPGGSFVIFVLKMM